MIRETLAKLWPELVVSAEAEDGAEALHAVEQHDPDDTQTPWLSGLRSRARPVAAAASFS